jgi:hypothetical protein
LNKGISVRVQFWSPGIYVNQNTSWACTWENANFDTDGMFTANTKLVCKVAGRYLIQGYVGWFADGVGGVGYRQMVIRLNGTKMLSVNTIPANLMVAAYGTLDQTTSCWVTLAVNDYVELLIFHNSGVAQIQVSTSNANTIYNSSYFAATKID